MKGRPGCWDSSGIAAGPQPEKLSNGDYLLIHNVDNSYRVSLSWQSLGAMRYWMGNIGWERSNQDCCQSYSTKPLIMATRDWETCQPHPNETTCQVPMGVFANGLKPLDTTTEGIGTTRSNEFYVIFGGADI